MSNTVPARTVLLAAALMAAQPGTAQPAPPSPLDAKTGVPALRWESPFAHFRRWSEGKPIAWRQANDTVAGIGGWRMYAREAQQPDAAPPAAPMPASADPAKPVPAAHGGHQAP